MAFLNKEKWRFKIVHGGRNGGKSHDFATSLAERGTQKKCLFLCLREYQKNLKDSVHRLLSDKINQEPALRQFYKIQRDTIIGKNGTEFVFSGIKNAVNIKSFEGADVAWIEEAQTLSADSLRILIPTIRKEGSEIWFSFNPRAITDPIYQFMMSNRQNKKVVQINYLDNPNCPQLMIDEANELKAINYEFYEHDWLGKPYSVTDDVIFKGCYTVDDLGIFYNGLQWLDDKSNVYYMQYGGDFGFSAHPTALIEFCFIDDNTIYANRELHEYQLLITKYKEKIKEKIPQALDERVYWDCSSSDRIAQLRADGLDAMGAKKGAGSVEAGIEYLKGKRLIVHPRCKHLIYELDNYKYKTDKNSGIITTDIIKENDHLIDAWRYGLTQQIQAKNNLNKIYKDDNSSIWD